METAERATWNAAYVNDLPDSAFLYVESGGSKDSEGKTTPRSLRHFPVKDANGNIDMPHLRNALSRIPQSNLPQSVKDSATAKAQRMMSEMQASVLPDGELRFQGAQDDLFELRDGESGMPTLVGHFAVFDQWTEINSRFEGQFLERLSPGAFDKTIAENRRNMRVLFNHGKDQAIGEKVLGPINELRTDTTGVYYEVPLYDTSYNRDLIPGLRDNQYGASFRFRAMKEEFKRKVEPSDVNPDGLPERTITEAKVMEFGPVTFPAYEGASAGLRSATDWWYEKRLLTQLERLGVITGDERESLEGAAALAEPTEGEEKPEVTQQSRRTSSRDYLQPPKEAGRWV